jgi:hypothetical protein
MKKKLFFIMALSLLIMSIPLQTVQAQETPHIFTSTKPINASLRTALDAWLAVDNPSTAIYYAVTYAHSSGFDTLVSLAGFEDISNGWSITGDADGVSHVIWLGSVRVKVDGEVERMTEDVQQVRGNGYDVASIDFIPHLAPMRAGGGDTI